MKFEVDCHTHTIASAHAYSTVLELAKAASDRELSILAITDHAPAMRDASDELHFLNYVILDRTLYGVQMMYGVELNIMDSNGTIDLQKSILENMDLCIASYHRVCTAPGTKEENTRAYMNAMHNPYVDIIGHPEDGNVPVDLKLLVKEAKETGVLLEVNNNSLSTTTFRKNGKENMMKMLELCAENEVLISMGSDAHFANAVGNFTLAEQVLKEVQFPEHLIANLTAERFLNSLKKRANRSHQ